MDIDLESMDLNELFFFQDPASSEIDTREARHFKEARAELERVAAEMGFRLKDLVENEASGTSAPPKKVKFVDPKDPSRTWSGRGRRPYWFVERIEEGIPKDELLAA